jgi:hypothetical protein
MSGSIRVHPKYGLNPTLPQCIICGEDTGEIIIGASFKDKNGKPCAAPMKCGVVSLEPCPKCREKYLTDGVLLVEVEEDRKYRRPLAVITVEAFNRLFNAPIPPKHIAVVETGLLEKIGVVPGAG